MALRRLRRAGRAVANTRRSTRRPLPAYLAWAPAPFGVDPAECPIREQVAQTGGAMAPMGASSRASPRNQAGLYERAPRRRNGGQIPLRKSGAERMHAAPLCRDNASALRPPRLAYRVLCTQSVDEGELPRPGIR